MRQLTLRRLSLIALGGLAVITLVMVLTALGRTRGETTAVPLPAPASTSPAAVESSPAAPAETASPTPSTSVSDDSRPTAVFLGDEFTAGAPWPQLAGEAMGWQVVNLAQAGQGYRAAPPSCDVDPCTPFSGMVGRITEQAPEVVVIAGGDADGDYPLETLATTTLTDLREALPDAQILVLSPLSARSPRPYWLTMHAESLQAAAESADATFVDVSSVAREPASYADQALTPEANTQLASLLVAASE